MADVTGTIGNEYVELNNAATEATLRALLMAVTSANKQNVSEIRRLAEKTGAASAAAVSNEASNFISRVCVYVRKTSRFYNDGSFSPNSP